MSQESETGQPEAAENFRATTWMPAIVGICISVFCLLSLVSFSPADYPEWQQPANTMPANWCGKAGAFLSLKMFHLFGTGSYFIVMVVAGWAIRMSMPTSVEERWQRLIGSVLMIIFMCAAMQLVPTDPNSAARPGNGGVIGISLVHFLSTYFGAVGKVLVIVSLLFLSALLATNELLIQTFGVAQNAFGKIPVPGRQSMAIASTSSGHVTMTGAAYVPPTPEVPRGRRRERDDHNEHPKGKLGAVPDSEQRRADPPTRRLFGMLAERQQADCEAVAPPSLRMRNDRPPVVEGIPLGEKDYRRLEEEEHREEFDRELKRVTPNPELRSEDLKEKRKRWKQVKRAPEPPSVSEYDIPSRVTEPEATEPDPKRSSRRPIIKLDDDETVPPESTPEEVVEEFDERTYALTQDDVHTHLDFTAADPKKSSEMDTAHDPEFAAAKEDKKSTIMMQEDEQEEESIPPAEEDAEPGSQQDGETADEESESESAVAELDSDVSEEHESDTGLLAEDEDDWDEYDSDSELNQDSEAGGSVDASEENWEDDTPDGAFKVKEDDDSSSAVSINEKIGSFRTPEIQKEQKKRAVPKPKRQGKYMLPPIDLLDIPKQTRGRELESRQKVRQLEQALLDFKVGAEVVDIQRGPTVTMFELALAPGVKLNKIVTLSDDLAIAMRAMSVRVVAPIPGKSTVGLEIPNEVKEAVRLRELVENSAVREDMMLPLYLGKDVAGNPVVSDLASMPHLLIAGSTGSGKSVCINSLIASILIEKTPDEVRLVLIDPKMVELSGFEDIPHLLSPVVTDMKKAPSVLEWAVKKMDQRYDLLASVGVRHLKQFNELGEERIKSRLLNRGAILEDVPYHLPYIVLVVDEYADLMMVASKDVEKSITRLAQKSRAVGIHVILATQRPSVDVITGLIKSNMTTRIGFRVSSMVDSRTILDRKGAEKLVGMGDMLFLPPGKSDLIRSQGVFVSDDELNGIVEFIKAQDNPEYEPELEDIGDLDGGGEDFSARDKLYDQAVRIVLQTGRGSVSLLQRKLEIGYTRAARLMDFMAKDGIVGGYKGSKAREVQITLEEWEEIRRSAD